MLAALLLALTLPNPTLTPGLVRPLSRVDICATQWGRDRRHVTARMRRQVGRWYGIQPEQWDCCELDHLIPRSMGGADDVRNLWFQPWPEARLKDRLEVKMDKLVCAGTVSLRDAQEMFRTDWRVGYERYIGRQP